MNQFRGDAAALEALANDRQGKRILRLRFRKDDAPANAFMLANRLDASEGLGQDYAFTVEVLSDNAAIPHDDVLGKMVTVELVREDGTLRFFNGFVFDFSFLKTDGGFAYYQLVLEPWLSYLRLRQDNVAFHDMSVIDMTTKICDEYIKRDWRHRVVAADPPITYSCQHNESEHNFLHRHWEARGWHYYYEHRADGHSLVLCDDSTRCALPIAGERTDMPYQDKAGVAEDDGIHGWSPGRRIGSDKVTAVSFNFKHPRPKRVERTSAQSRSAEPQLEVYENTGTYGFKDFDDGQALAQLRIEELDTRRSEYRAKGNDRTAEPGRWFTLSGYPESGNAKGTAAQKYLITSVRHEATNNYQDGRDAVSSYSNEMTCIAHNLPWRPGRGFNSEEPKIFGVQTAVVVGPPGEEIYTDGYGRVKVQFHWDRKGEFDDKSSPWVRVLTTWAGPQFGQISLPRVGMEVALHFLDGNINHPLIIGCVFNANNMPPWELPLNKTQSGILTRSTKEGRSAHANAIRFEDKRGEEEVWLHAQKDQRIEVEHDEAHWVGNDRRKTVDHNETVEVKNDQQITVHNNRSERVDHEEKISIGDNRTEDVGKNETINIGGNRTKSVVKNQKDSIGRNWSINVTKVKTETIGMAYMQNVGMGRMENVGLGYDLNVGLVMATVVGASQFTKVGKTVSISAGDKIQLICGQSKLVLTPTAIYIEGNDVHIKSSSKVQLDGPADVLLNSGSAQSAPLGPKGKEE
ncbi:type VI secretion system Vgr family protein [Massilia soli]|uniref:Type VI secretion system tip protein VgrG n=1 Tax=Massilia soli TaxID=2792854 RepID=A0ABS7SNH9_9BURK|nr:type VI secretion system tip protein TssI/VgrG [Massilia soli]MBZ2207612.1 type VI secretion system tip protein VgrG [Massilia soli]